MDRLVAWLESNDPVAGHRLVPLDLGRSAESFIFSMRGAVMRSTRRCALVVELALVASQGVQWTLIAQVLPNPYRIVEGWAQLPIDRPVGALGMLAIYPDGRDDWAIVRGDRRGDPARFDADLPDS